jgi:hypothetical protein
MAGVDFFPWMVLAFLQWGWADIPLRFYMKVMQHTQVVSAVREGHPPPYAIPPYVLLLCAHSILS